VDLSRHRPLLRDPDTNLEATLFDAGHILGSTGVLVREGSNTLFYTGDVNFEAQTICRAADFPTSGIDVMIAETTRGDYARPENFSRKAEKERLAGPSYVTRTRRVAPCHDPRLRPRQDAGGHAHAA
jgi:Cft2 family RNA processing exonuclease